MKMHSATIQTKNSYQIDAHFSPASILIASCFESRTLAHYSHLKTKSYAAHVALSTYYDSIITVTDAYAESYQGLYGIICCYPTIVFDHNNAPDFIVELRNIIDCIRKDCGTRSELQNDIDSIMSLCNSTIYKLNFLQ